jgi:hypothetical protein
MQVGQYLFSIRLRERVMLIIKRYARHLNHDRSVKGESHATEERNIPGNRIQKYQDRNETWQAEKTGGGDSIESGTQVRRQDFEEKRQVICVYRIPGNSVGRTEAFASVRVHKPTSIDVKQLPKAASSHCRSCRARSYDEEFRITLSRSPLCGSHH